MKKTILLIIVVCLFCSGCVTFSPELAASMRTLHAGNIKVAEWVKYDADQAKFIKKWLLLSKEINDYIQERSK